MTLKEAISTSKLNLVQIAWYAGISRSTLHNVMTGRTLPSYATARKLATTLNKPLEFTEVAGNIKHEIQVSPN